ncbi:MAG: bacterioferritin [Gammaproteobacteria bacterium]|nr:bacterioferritin [Gammaproteobacteria bacterium]
MLNQSVPNNQPLDKTQVLAALNKILELELGGVVRYTHYALMVYGYNRIPIIAWLREQAECGLRHANEAGELITHLGEHPSLLIGPLLETHQHDIGDILRESLEHERQALHHYHELPHLARDRSVLLEKYARPTWRCSIPPGNRNISRCRKTCSAAPIPACKPAMSTPNSRWSPP